MADKMARCGVANAYAPSKQMLLSLIWPVHAPLDTQVHRYKRKPSGEPFGHRHGVEGGRIQNSLGHPRHEHPVGSD